MKGKSEQLRLSSRKRRIAAYIIDHLVMTFLIVSLVFLAIGPGFLNSDNGLRMVVSIFTAMLPAFLLYFAKDSFKGTSVGKWIMGIMVRDENDTSVTPSFGRLFLRNLPLIIWPVEFIVLVASDEKRRLGDKSANTIVVINPGKPRKTPRILALISVGVIFFAFIFSFVISSIKSSEAYKVAVHAIEHNEEIINETGGIKGYGLIPKGNISVTNGSGQASLEITVLGNVQDLDISVYLTKEPGGEWDLIEMSK